MSDIKCEYYGFSVDPKELDFEVEEGYTFLPEKQWIYIRKEGPGELSPRWNATADADWVDFRSTTGSVPARIGVTPKSVGMPAGDYVASITISSSLASTEPQTVAIKLIVKAKPEPPKPLKIITAALPYGEVGKAYECQIEAEGGVSPYKWFQTGLPEGLIFDSQTAQITGGPLSGGVFSSQTAQITGGPLSGGVFSVNITVQDSTYNSSIMEYRLHIIKPPAEVAITSPIGGEVWYIGDPHDITWVADNGEGEALGIELFYDGQLVSLAGVPIKALKYSWKIVEGVSEDAIIRLVTSHRVVESGPFVIREYSKCPLCQLAIKTLNFLNLRRR